MHLDNIPDEGEALTSNPLAKRQNSRKAFKNKQTEQHEAALEAFAVPKGKKNLLKSISYITTAIFIDFLIICCLFSVH